MVICHLLFAIGRSQFAIEFMLNSTNDK